MKGLFLFLLAGCVGMNVMAAESVAELNATATAATAALDWPGAAEAYTQLNQLEPDNAAHLTGLGRSQMMQGDYPSAIASLTAAKKAGATGANEYFLARSYAGAGMKAEMMDSLEAIRVAGGTPYVPMQSANEFRAFDEDPEFTALALKLRPCQTENHRAFDFWLGKWDVFATGTENLVGYNTISAIEGGCVVHEQYHTPGNFSGQSFNFYDSTRGVWHQTWVDNQGSALFIEGGLVDGNMVLEDASHSNRITYVPNADGSVRQHWESSSDGGETWSTAFDGHYVRAKED